MTTEKKATRLGKATGHALVEMLEAAQRLTDSHGGSREQARANRVLALRGARLAEALAEWLEYQSSRQEAKESVHDDIGKAKGTGDRDCDRRNGDGRDPGRA